MIATQQGIDRSIKGRLAEAKICRKPIKIVSKARTKARKIKKSTGEGVIRTHEGLKKHVGSQTF